MSNQDLSRHYIAIDPGANGGIAWTTPDNSERCRPLPDTLVDTSRLIFDILHEQGFFDGSSKVSCHLEEPPKFVKAIPGSAVFVMARNFGQLEGILAAYRVPTQLIRPQAWQQRVGGLGTKGEQTTSVWKNKLKARAQQLYPEQKITLATSDALLILWSATQGAI
jgi:hypothetical protein